MKKQKQKNGSLKRFGAKLQRLRADRHVTIEELAANRLSSGNLSEIENGKRDPRLSTLCRISARLGVPLGELLEDIC